LLTFNFINIAWIFFRAKEWGDAVKVLGSMFSLDNIILPNILESRLPFLSDLGVEFGGFVEHIQGDYFTPVWLVAGFVMILTFKNSTEKLDSFKLNYKAALWSGIAFAGGVLSLTKVSEFLYFNF
jgi:hypothetical protein